MIFFFLRVSGMTAQFTRAFFNSQPHELNNNFGGFVLEILPDILSMRFPTRYHPLLIVIYRSKHITR